MTAEKIDRTLDIHQILAQGDDSGSARTGDYVHMNNYDQLMLIAQSATIGNACTITVTQTTQDANGNSDSKALSSGTATIVFSTAAADDNALKVLLITVDQMDKDNNFDWLEIKTSGAAAAVLGIVGVAGGARYMEFPMPAMET